MSGYAIEVSELTKEFGRFRAVESLSFRVARGSVFGLLGANGAGKSTTIRMLCGLLQSSSGTATVGGYDINRQPEDIKRNIGYMSQRFSLYEDLPVRENILFFGGVYGLTKGEIRDRLDWSVLAGGIERWMDHQTGELPVGWRQRLALICAVLHRPRILFLDEPTGGVDPLSRRDFWEIINELAFQGTTVVVTTHYLDEAEYCHQIVLMHDGKMIAQGSPKELKATLTGRSMLEVRCDKPVEAMDLLQREPWVSDTTLFAAGLHLNLLDENEGRQKILKILIRNNIRVEHIEAIMPSLEDVFIHLIKGQSEDPAAQRHEPEMPSKNAP